MKSLVSIFIIGMLLVSCSRPLSPTDLKLQGEWMRINTPEVFLGGFVINSVKFDGNNFVLESDYYSDTSPFITKINLKTKYYSDNQTIFVENVKPGTNLNFFGGHNNENIKNKELSYTLKTDTLMLFSKSHEQDGINAAVYINKHIFVLSK